MAERSTHDVRTALLSDCALKGRAKDVVKLIQEGNLSIDGIPPLGILSPLMQACRGGSLECVTILLQHGARIDATDSGGATALFWAVMMGEAQCARLCISHGALVNIKDAHGNTPLHVAASCADRDRALQCVQVLLDHSADACASGAGGMTPLYIACQVLMFHCGCWFCKMRTCDVTFRSLGFAIKWGKLMCSSAMHW